MPRIVDLTLPVATGMAGIPTIPSFGPGILTCAHGPNECVSLKSVDQAARIYARVAAAFCGPENGTGGV